MGSAGSGFYFLTRFSASSFALDFRSAELQRVAA